MGVFENGVYLPPFQANYEWDSDDRRVDETGYPIFRQFPFDSKRRLEIHWRYSNHTSSKTCISIIFPSLEMRLILASLVGIMIAHSRETYQPTSISWDGKTGYFQWLKWDMGKGLASDLGCPQGERDRQYHSGAGGGAYCGLSYVAWQVLARQVEWSGWIWWLPAG